MSGHGDRGAGVVVVLAVMAVGATLAVAAALFGRALVARHRVQAAADLAALAAAAAWPLPACDRADRVARGNGAVLVSCQAAADGSVVVVARVRVPGLPIPGAAVTARARAGRPGKVVARTSLPSPGWLNARTAPGPAPLR